MAISLIGTPTTGSGNNPASGTWTLPAGYAANDLIVVWCFSRVAAWMTGGSGFTATGPTQKVYTTTGVAGIYIGYEWCTSDSMTAPTFARGATSTNCTVVWGCFIVRGVTNSTGGYTGDPFDGVSGAAATAYAAVEDPDPPAVTPGRIGDWAVTFVGRNDEAAVTSPPSGYTHTADMFVSQASGTDGAGGFAYKEVASTSPEDPGTWNLDAQTNQSGYTWTGSLRRGINNYASSVVALTVGLTTSGSVFSPAETFYGQVVLPLAGSLTTAGRLVAKAQATQALTATVTTVAVRALRAQATQALSTGFTSAGQRTTFGQATASLTVDLVSDGVGTTPSTGEDVFGTAVMALAWDSVTDAHLAQYALPAVDSVDGAWTTQANGTDLEQAIDDLTVDDSDYIRSELNPDMSACRVKLEGLTDPDSSTGHVLRWRIGKDAPDGNTVNMTLSLYQGGGDVLGAGTLVASFARNDVAAGFATFEEHLSGAEADMITDYGALYLELAGDVA